ncbi:MAG: AcrR family transcriptional regulator [Saprospiraceae bacterium]|jgi:AcrR family transcriptional regulator
MSEKENGTEYKIKEAARKVFLEKGFAATKTREIAEAADINLALLNYYFRSKKKLYDIIMIETLQSFSSGVISIFNDESTSIREKVSLFVNHYIDLLTQNENVAPFIINAVRDNPEEYISKIGILDKVKGSIFIQQFQEGMVKGEIPSINPVHFILNLMSLIVFPFIAQPMVSVVSGIPKDSFLEIVQERKRLIPLWIESMLSVE